MTRADAAEHAEPKNRPKCKSPYRNKPKRTPAHGNPAYPKAEHAEAA